MRINSQKINKNRANLKTISTRELVEELATREGVEIRIAEPYEDIIVTANGPAIILRIID